jgi:hypothetical protein
MKKFVLALTFVSLAAALAVSTQAVAAPTDTSRLASKYADWAGGKSNADSIVNGLRNGESITLVTVSPTNVRNLAGFTAQTRMSPEEISTALAEARRSLAGMGIKQPSADQIQAALIGGEVALPNGKTKLVGGTVTLRMEPEIIGTVTPVAAR